MRLPFSSLWRSVRDFFERAVPPLRYQQNWKYRREIFIPASFWNLKLSKNAFIVCCYLSKCADKHGRAWPTIKTIKDQCHIKLNSAVEAIRELEACGLLEIVRKKPGIYQLTNSDKWKMRCYPKGYHDVIPRDNYDVTPTRVVDPLPEPTEVPEGTPYKVHQ
jgi:hypothetical protein